MIGTPTEAAQWACPQSRAFSEPRSKCRGPECAWWRWKELDAAILKPALAAEMARNGGNHKKAVETVMENREALGIPTKPTHGYCGAAGEPKA